MRKFLLATMVAVMLIPGLSMAQKAGSFILGLNAGFTSPVSDFKNDTLLLAKGGLGFGAELRYTLIRDLSFGPFIQYNHFSSDLVDDRGQASFNFTQMGGLARFNLLNASSGKIYLSGGGGIFTPNEHFWSISGTQDQPSQRGNFFFGGLGLSSDPKSTVIYNLEFRYNSGKANTSNAANAPSLKYDFISINMKLEFNSKGVASAPRY
jgi:hypothetical protein